MASGTANQNFSELMALFGANFSGGWANVAQNASSPLTNLYVSLHNGWPGELGTQATNETTYSNYARVAVPRVYPTNWTGSVGSNSSASYIENTNAITFPACGVTGDTVTFWGIGSSASGAGNLYYYGPLAPVTDFAYVQAPFVAIEGSPGILFVDYPTTSYFTVNAQVMLFPVPQLGQYSFGGGYFPSAYTPATSYYVGTVSTNAGAPGSQITLSTTPSNANPVNNVSGTGSGYLYLVTPTTVSLGYAPTIPEYYLHITKF